MATTGQNIRAKWLSNTRKKYYLFNAEHRELMGIFVHYNYLLSIYLRDFFQPGEGVSEKDNDYREAMAAYFYSTFSFPFHPRDGLVGLVISDGARLVINEDNAFAHYEHKARIDYTQWKEIDTFFREDYEGGDIEVHGAQASQREVEIYRDYHAKFDRIFALHDAKATKTSVTWSTPRPSFEVKTVKNNPLYSFVTSCSPAKRKKLTFLDLLNYAYLAKLNLVAQDKAEKIINSAVLLTTSSTTKTHNAEDIADIVSTLCRTVLVLTMNAPALTTTRDNQRVITPPQKQYARELVHNVHKIVTSSHSDEEFSLLTQCAGLCAPLNTNITLHNSIYHYTQQHNFHPPRNSYQLCANFVEFCRARNENIVNT